jgi:NitT/TauT family transport system permease protein
VLAVGILAFLIGVVDLGQNAVATHENTNLVEPDAPKSPEQIEIEEQQEKVARKQFLELRNLPRYTFYSLCRGLLAYGLSLGFTLVYGYWAAKDRRAATVLLPTLDILQSIPVLGFLPGVLLTFRALFPTNNIGLEIASVLLIFTGQAWNMTFSFYHSLMSIPQEQREVASIFRFTWFERLTKLELPFATMGLVWNSMMSMAGGWFFLTACEAMELGEVKVRLPGIGSYMKIAIDEKDVAAQLWAIFAMILMIVGLDQLLWRPIVVWAQKFRTEEGAGESDDSSWFLDFLRRSRFLTFLERWHKLRTRRASSAPSADPTPISHAAGAATNAPIAGQLPTRPIAAQSEIVSPVGSLLVLGLLGIGMLWGLYRLVEMLRLLSLDEWGTILASAGVTLGRVILSTAIGTLLAVPVGLAIGLSPRLARSMQPIVQVAASFPMPMLYPLAVGVMILCGIDINFGSVILMLLGTMWYILFNVIAGAMVIPSDLREAATSFHILGRQRFWTVYAPGIFPYLVTGWVTAAGGAWNASILAELVSYNGDKLRAFGLGGLITQATDDKNFPLLSAGVLVMALVVVLFNRTVWRPLYRLAETRFSLSK